MSSSKGNDIDALLLEPFELKNRKIGFRTYAGCGRAGCVFQVRIGDKDYALKMVRSTEFTLGMPINSLNSSSSIIPS